MTPHRERYHHACVSFPDARTEEAFRLLIFSYIACVSIGLLWFASASLPVNSILSGKNQPFLQFYTQNNVLRCSHRIEHNEVYKFFLFCVCVYLFSIWAKFLFGFFQSNALSSNAKNRTHQIPCVLYSNFFLTQFNKIGPNSDSKLYKFLIESYLLISFCPLPLLRCNGVKVNNRIELRHVCK